MKVRSHRCGAVVAAALLLLIQNAVLTDPLHWSACAESRSLGGTTASLAGSPAMGAGPGPSARRVTPTNAPRDEAVQRLAKESDLEDAPKSGTDRKRGGADASKVWRSEDLSLLGIGMGVGDVDGDGQNEIVIAGPSSVSVYRVNPDKLSLMAEYSSGSIELKSIDVAKIRKHGPARIYVSAQNRGTLASLVLEYANGALTPVIQDVRYFLRVIDYPTRGPVLLAQQKGMNRMYDGPIYRVEDKGNELAVGDRFGIPLKIPIFGFAVGDLAGNRKPLIAVYDKSDHLRIYNPQGKRLYVSKDWYGGSDVILRWGGPEERKQTAMRDDADLIYFRPRIACISVPDSPVSQILAIAHSSKTGRYMGRSKMLDEGRVVGLVWNSDALVEQWRTPNIQGMVTDFAIDYLPGMASKRLIVLERKKTDWLSFLRSASQVKAYDLEAIMRERPRATEQ
ncbi:MAG: hypothetical protein HY914_03475 [Desulfomonile tiedjei]|nr:hypothetical protein [Desulfomonile tiedjei]